VVGQASSRDMYQSIQKAIDRIETQGRREREKALGRKRRAGGAKEDVVLRAVRSAAPPVEEAPPPALVEEALDRLKPIGVEEAVLLLEKARRPFVAFRNAATGAMAVIYRRPDGKMGLVAPRR
jgi:putative sigma-54 modulation protein